MESQCHVSGHLTRAGEMLLFLLAEKCHFNPEEAGGRGSWEMVKDSHEWRQVLLSGRWEPRRCAI